MRNIKISLSDDEMKAFITITPDPSVSISLMDLGPVLKQHGVVYGIKRDVLAIVVERYRNGDIINNILVAEGVEPNAGVKPTLDLKFSLSSTPKTDSSGRMDYREISRILNIKKGQLLAVKTILKQPVDGISVTGKRTLFPPFDDIPLHIGQYIDVEHTLSAIFYRAAEDGALKYENDVISIMPILDISEDVDFNSGNIHFKGDVRVGRDVLPDFLIEAEGNISIFGSAIACTLKATEGIEVRGGIVGKNKGIVESGADISATFVENAHLSANRDIIVKNGIIGSQVSCHGLLTVESPRSRIVGSTIRAAKGISSRNIGSRFDTSTVIITGIDPVKFNEVLKVQEFMDSKVKEANEIEKRHGRTVVESNNPPSFASAQARDDIKRWQLLKKEIQSIHHRLKHLESEMHDLNAVVRVKETLSPRVSITIGKYKLSTTQEYFNVTVKYSPDNDNLVIV